MVSSGRDDLDKKSSGLVRSKTDTLPQNCQVILVDNPKLTGLIEQNRVVINIRSQEDESRKRKGMLREEIGHIHYTVSL